MRRERSRKSDLKRLVHGSITSGEFLAVQLQLLLRDLRRSSRRNSSRSPVRGEGRLPRSVIAEIALYILDGCDETYPPGQELKALIRMLVKVDPAFTSGTTVFPKRFMAAWMFAQVPTLGVREIAREVQVAPSTVSAWLSDPMFGEEIGRHRGGAEAPCCHALRGRL